MIILIIFLLELCVTMFFLNIGLNGELVSLAFIAINIFTCCVFFLKRMPASVSGILIFALCIRVLILFIDIYTTISIPFSGVDSETFDYIAKNNVQKGSMEYSLTPYTDFLTLIYFFFDSQRILAQYLNVILGVSTIYIYNKILLLLNIDKKTSVKACFLLAILPANILISSVLLRDVIVMFFSTLSLFWFIKWYMRRKKSNVIWIFVYLLIATFFHSGVLFMSFGYIISLALIGSKSEKIHISLKSYLVLLVSLLLFLFLVSNPTVFLSKFASLEEQDLTVRIASDRVEAGSRYLSWINPTSMIDIIIYSPLKMIYFLISPMIWDIRGLFDFLTIVFDASLFLYLLSKTIYMRLKCKNVKFIIRGLILSFTSVVFVFSWGVVAAGTAMRHREKTIYLLLLIFILLKKQWNAKNNKSNNGCIKP